MNTRPTILLAILGVGLAPAGAAQEQQRPEPALKLVISVPEGEIRAGSPVPLNLTLTNTSDHDVWFTGFNVSGPVFKHVPLRQIDIQVRDSDAELVTETEFGKTIHGRSVEQPPVEPPDPSKPGKPLPGTPRGVFMILQPGKALREQSDLSKEFDLSKPGRYTVHATTTRLDPDAGGRVQSNDLTFTIRP
jgi:hypothetical protein